MVPEGRQRVSPALIGSSSRVAPHFTSSGHDTRTAPTRCWKRFARRELQRRELAYTCALGELHSEHGVVSLERRRHRELEDPGVRGERIGASEHIWPQARTVRRRTHAYQPRRIRAPLRARRTTLWATRTTRARRRRCSGASSALASARRAPTKPVRFHPCSAARGGQERLGRRTRCPMLRTASIRLVRVFTTSSGMPTRDSPLHRFPS